MNVLDDAKKKAAMRRAGQEAEIKPRNILQEKRDRVASEKSTLGRKLGGGALGVLQGALEEGMNFADLLPYLMPATAVMAHSGFKPSQFVEQPHLSQFASKDIGAQNAFNRGEKVANLLPWAAGGIGAVKAAPTVARSIGKLISKMPVSNTSVGNKIIKGANKLEKSFGHEFDELLGSAQKHGIGKVSTKGLTSENLEYYSRIVPKKEQHKLRDFMKHRTIQSAHKADSDLATALRRMKNAPPNEALTDAMNAAQDMRKSIQNAMDEAFRKKGHTHFGEQYKNLKYRYATEMGPYLNNQNIVNARLPVSNENFMAEWRLPQELGSKGNDSFMRQMAHQYPELYWNRLLAGGVGKSLAAAGGLSGLASLAILGHKMSKGDY